MDGEIWFELFRFFTQGLVALGLGRQGELNLSGAGDGNQTHVPNSEPYRAGIPAYL